MRTLPPKNLWTDSAQGWPLVGYVADNEHDEAAFVAQEVDRLTDAELVVESERLDSIRCGVDRVQAIVRRLDEMADRILQYDIEVVRNMHRVAGAEVVFVRGEGVHVWDPSFASLGAREVAMVLAAAARKLPFDLGVEVGLIAPFERSNASREPHRGVFL